MDGNFFCAVWFLYGLVRFHCLPGRRLKWRAKGVEIAFKSRSIQVTTGWIYVKKRSSSRIYVISPTRSEN